ncbi:hypothetical protein CIB84_015554, partial [Bambusicola thoracicus]
LSLPTEGAAVKGNFGISGTGGLLCRAPASLVGRRRHAQIDGFLTCFHAPSCTSWILLFAHWLCSLLLHGLLLESKAQRPEISKWQCGAGSCLFLWQSQYSPWVLLLAAQQMMREGKGVP